MISRRDGPPGPAIDDRPDGPLPPSVLCLLCAGDDAPQSIEVMARLERCGFDVEHLEDGEEPAPVRWSRLVRLAGWDEPYSISVEPREPSFCPWNWSSARWLDQQQFENTKQARWLVVLETQFDPDRPHESYHLQVRVAAAIADGLAEACYDDDSFQLRSVTSLTELAACEVPPSPLEMFQIQWVGDERSSWMHTHGLRRFDVPDLEILALEEDDADSAWEAIAWLSSYLLGSRFASAGGEVRFGEGVVTVLRPLAEYLETVAQDDAGGSSDRDEDHLGWRMALTDPGASSLRPAMLLAKCAGEAVYWLSNYETRRRYGLAQARFPLAATAFYSQQFKERSFLVKVAVPADDQGTDLSAFLLEDSDPEDSWQEHMWFEVGSVKRAVIVAELMNDPLHAGYLNKGDTYSLRWQLVTDWRLVLDAEEYTPETITELDLVTYRHRWQDEEDWAG